MSKRHITVNNEKFTWHVGSQHVAIRRLDESEKPFDGRNPTLVDLTGPYWNWDSIEKARWKGSDFAIRPKLIALYIRREFFGEDVAIEFRDTILPAKLEMQ